MLRSRLCGDGENAVLQACDELYAHHLLSQTCEARYEEDEDSPDFRLYQASSYVAGAEVLTLFPNNALGSQATRNQALTLEINRRVPLTYWYLSYEVRRWTKQPRPKDVARWIKETIVSLGVPQPTPNLATHRATYSAPEAELSFTFFPRSTTTPPSPSARIVAASPWLGGILQHERRIRDRLSQKVGAKYDHRNRPFAVIMCIRDLLCDTEDIVDTIYGHDAIPLEGEGTNTPQSAQKINGIFGVSPAHPEGRVRRLSCVFVLMRGWMPLSKEPPKVIRLDNPWARQAFPDGLLDPDFHLAVRGQGTEMFMEWVPQLGE